MAGSPVAAADIASALATLFEDSIPAQFNRAVVLSQVLPYVPGTSKNLQWDVKTGTLPTSSKLADGNDVTDYNNDPLTPAVLQWATYSEAFGVTGKARATAAAAGNPDQLVELFADKIEDAITRLAANINLAIWTGDGSTDEFMGLLDATKGGLLAVGSYAGIDRGSVTQWRGNVLANGGNPRPLTLQLMRDMRRTIYTASGEMPDLIVTDPIQHEAYGTLLGVQRRYVEEVTMRGRKVVLDGGYKALEFDGIPVIMDKDCPSGTMTFLNTRHVRLRSLPDAPGDMGETGEDGPARVALHGTPEEQLGGGQTSMTARINPLAVTGDAFKFQLILYPQVQVRRPNANGVLKDLSS